MSGHTKGPWLSHKSSTRSYNLVVVDSDGRTIANIESGSINFPRREKDALLMAAAPEMLAALQNVRTSYATGHNAEEAWGWVDAAIAKATTAHPE